LALNGVVERKYPYIPITAAQLAQTTFQVGTLADQMWVQAFDGAQWGAWTIFNINPAAGGYQAPATVANGATLELTAPYAGTVTFAGPTGTLKLDQSASFNGKIGGQLAPGDVIDLADITAGAGATMGYTGNNSPGTLTVGDGTRIASIVLLGNYSPGDFTPASDGHGGTSVADPPPAFADYGSIGGAGDFIMWPRNGIVISPSPTLAGSLISPDPRTVLLVQQMASAFPTSGLVGTITATSTAGTPPPAIVAAHG
jgi:hypothetical protein